MPKRTRSAPSITVVRCRQRYIRRRAIIHINIYYTRVNGEKRIRATKRERASYLVEILRWVRINARRNDQIKVNAASVGSWEADRLNALPFLEKTIAKGDARWFMLRICVWTSLGSFSRHPSLIYNPLSIYTRNRQLNFLKLYTDYQLRRYFYVSYFYRIFQRATSICAYQRNDVHSYLTSSASWYVKSRARKLISRFSSRTV